MLALSPPSMQRSEPAKLSSKKARTLVPADYSDVDETDLRRFALKRSSLEKALRWTDGAPAQNSSFVEQSTLTPLDTAIDHNSVALVPISPPGSPLSQNSVRPVLKRTASPSVPPMSSASLPNMPSRRPSFQRTASALNLPTGCSPCFSRAPIDSVSASSSSSSSSGSRRSSISSVKSTESTDSSCSSGSTGSESSTKNSRLRAIPCFFVSAATGTYLAFKVFFNPPPTPEQMLTIEPIPVMRDKPYKPNQRIPPAFVDLAPGEKGTQLLYPVPPRRDPSAELWPHFVHIPDV